MLSSKVVTTAAANPIFIVSINQSITDSAFFYNPSSDREIEVTYFIPLNNLEYWREKMSFVYGL